MADEQTPAGKPQPAAGGHAAPKAPTTMATAPWESDLTRQIQEHFLHEVLEFSSYLGQEFVVARPEAVAPLLEYLKLEAEFDYLVDVTAVDYAPRPDRFDLVYVLYSFARNQRIRIKTRIPDGFKPETAVNVHRTADWLEREVFDMFGITFAGHPDLRRILMPLDWVGHPQRKDYPLEGPGELLLESPQHWLKARSATVEAEIE